MATKIPEIANSIKTGSFDTNYHDYSKDKGNPVVLIHGSGPGVTSWANWGKVMPKLSENRRVLAPDMVGFGYTQRPDGIKYSMDGWVQQTIDFLDAMGLDKVDLVGNSFGGALAMAVAILYPNRIRRLVLMGSMGVDFPITDGLDTAWGYTPSFENMEELLKLFVSDEGLINDELVKSRFEASTQTGFQESFSSMFPAPRYNSVKEMAKYESRIPEIQHETLIIHGREDKVIPTFTSERIFKLISNAQLHIFGHCGHWTQIEQNAKFVQQVDMFLS